MVAERVPLQRWLIPYHFGQRWYQTAPTPGVWCTAAHPRLADRLTAVAAAAPDLVVSGDCMAAIAAQRPGLDLVWMDAHGDFNTLLTTETGNLGGMPLAMICGLGDQGLVQACRTERPPSVIHVGGCAFDPGELERMAGLGVQVEPGDTVLVPPRRSIHLHIDTDVICAAEFPASIHPPPPGEGLTLRQFYAHLDVLLPSTAVLSIKGYSPGLTAAAPAAAVVQEIIRRFEHGYVKRAHH